VDAETLAVLDEAVGGSPHVVGPQGESLFAAEGRLLGAFTLSVPPAASRVALGAVADPLDTVLDLDHQEPYVVVALDRAGGDIDAYPAGAFDPATSRTYDGSTLHLTRVRAGGNSMASYHRRAKNVWSENAAGVAAEIAEAAEEVGARLVLVGGDPKAVGVLRLAFERVSLPVRMVEVAGGRGGGDAESSLRASVDRALAEESRASHLRAMDEYRQALGQGLAVQGITQVCEAFARGGVSMLMLSADRDLDPLLWGTFADPRMVGTAREALGEHAEDAFTAPAADLLLRAAVLTGATFGELLPDAADGAAAVAQDGCAAILRYAG
jgi:hypothetical protein